MELQVVSRQAIAPEGESQIQRLFSNLQVEG
jgi:hypothetical protein